MAEWRDRTVPAEPGAPAQDGYETRYRALFEAIDDGFCIIEFVEGPEGPLSDYIHIEANSGYARHTGISDIVGKSVYDIAPTEAPAWVRLYRQILDSGQPLRFEREFVDAGRFIEVSAARVEPASLNQVSVLFRDITARKTAEIALRASEAKARDNNLRVSLALAAGAIIGTWFWNIPEDDITIDEAFAKAFGMDAAAVHERISFEKALETVHPEDRPKLRAAVGKVLVEGGDYVNQYRTLRADGAYHWLEANGRVDLDATGAPFLFSGVLVDISQKRALEEERDRANEELRRLNETLEERVSEQTAALLDREDALRQAQKMEAVGQLTGGLAHDFNNLLAAISGSLELLQTRIDEGRHDRLDHYVEVARGATQRAAALTHRLLAFARRQTLEPKVTDPLALVRDLEDLLCRTVGPHIDITVQGGAQAASILIDQNQLESAVLNLCVNARDAMPGGGRLAIRVTDCTVAPPEAEELGVAPGDFVEIAVEDTGSGIAPDLLERVLEPFFTTKPMGQGTGLGLSMVYGFVQQSGGHLVIRSEPGRGTTVALRFPRSGAALPVAEPRRVEAGPVSVAGRTVLVVDDEVLVRMLLVEVVQDLGLTVLEAGNGPDALRILQTTPAVDLLLTDVGLPRGMNGHQLVDAARTLRPDLPVIFVTGYDETAVSGNRSATERTEILTKPVDLAELTRKVRDFLS
ncbi:ATP-binding protein [Frigidibacter sp. MR17.14]|uniref:ATP-binding protein n=1 Tax=Frigidibacter sp. MR17.14 TaxID=3126509 RepID=UPI003012DFCC